MRVLFMLAALALVGCAFGGGGPPDSSASGSFDASGDGIDGGTREDAGPRDDAGRAGSPDASREDAGFPSAGDAGGGDAAGADGGADAGACAVDRDCPDDGLACNGAPRCVSGACVSGPPVVCDDGITCTVDSCREPAGSCASVADDGRCGSRERCDPGLGCVPAPECVADADCDDGQACNGTERCVAGACRAGPPPSCDDGRSCTVDRCDPLAAGGTGACTFVGSDAACDDGRACNGRERCAPLDPGASGATGCVAGIPIRCDDGIACTADACVEPAGSCSHVAPSERCNGADDDCDGRVDEGFTCALGSTAACTTSCGTAGSRACNGSCTGYGGCVAAEVCNGCDDDSDGRVDEGLSCVPAPSNDRCSGAIALSGRGSRSDTLAGASLDVGLGGGMCGTGPEVFYRVTLTRESLVYLDTLGTSWDTLVSYRGTSCPGPIRPPQCADDQCGGLQSQLVRELSPGTHYFAVHALSPSSPAGAFTLSYQIESAGGALDTRVTGRATYAHTTAGGSDLVRASCGAGATGPESVYWWTQCPGDSRAVSMNTCTAASFDTVMHLWGPSGELSCNDDYGGCGPSGRSSLVFRTTSGAGLYRMFVDGYGGASGTYTLDVTSF